MRANELRIGNWVSNGDIEFQITSKDIYHRDVRVYGSFIKGIPITPEWLERVGFEKNIFSNGDYKYIKSGLSISSNLQSANWKFGRIENERCKYVHQLQNLYFALTGEELEYKPNI